MGFDALKPTVFVVEAEMRNLRRLAVVKNTLGQPQLQALDEETEDWLLERVIPVRCLLNALMHKYENRLVDKHLVELLAVDMARLLAIVFPLSRFEVEP